MARNITVIPAKSTKETATCKNDGGKTRVAAYCRVSTELEDQLHSFETQVEYYTDYINKNPDYEMAGIYADEGISGTSVKKRAQFKKMIEDCNEGKIDLIITKSISRFARNTQDCLKYTRDLKSLGIPVYFEKENINTLDSAGELLFTILSSLAQDESRNISENCKWGIRSGFKKGILHIQPFLGYDRDEDGKPVINEEQAKIVRRIYMEFLDGKAPFQIARGLEEDGIPTSHGAKRWSSQNLIKIISNEKYKGDALLQKYYVKDFISKKLVLNKGEVTQYYVTDNHEAIVTRDIWEAANEELNRQMTFKKNHEIMTYATSRGDWYPFMNTLFCENCGKRYLRIATTSPKTAYWICSGHRKNGILTCDNKTIKDVELKEAFVKAINSLYEKKEKMIDDKRKQIKKGTALQKHRARQMIALLQKPPITEYKSDLAQMVIEEVMVLEDGRLSFRFLDGTSVNIKTGKQRNRRYRKDEYVNLLEPSEKICKDFENVIIVHNKD